MGPRRTRRSRALVRHSLALVVALLAPLGFEVTLGALVVEGEDCCAEVERGDAAPCAPADCADCACCAHPLGLPVDRTGTRLVTRAVGALTLAASERPAASGHPSPLYRPPGA